MKRLIFTTLLIAATTSLFAQSDSIKTVTDSVKHKKGYTVNFNFKAKKDSVSKRNTKKTGFSMGLTFTRFDFGFTTLLDNGSFRLSPKNDFLNYRSWKTSNVGFDVFQFGYRFNSTFKIYGAGGFDWELIRLRNDITINRDPDQSALKYTNDPIHYSKDRFSSAYLRLPLMFDFRSKDNYNGKAWHYVFGPEAGILLTGRMKQISDENGKQKNELSIPLYKVSLRSGSTGRPWFAWYICQVLF